MAQGCIRMSGYRAKIRSSQPATITTRLEDKSPYLTSVPHSWASIGSAPPNDYTNQDIYNRAGEKLGTIKEMLIGPDGKMTAAVVNVGRFLGIGDKDLAVPFSALQMEQRGNSHRIVIDVTRDALQAAPPLSDVKRPNSNLRPLH